MPAISCIPDNTTDLLQIPLHLQHILPDQLHLQYANSFLKKLFKIILETSNSEAEKPEVICVIKTYLFDS